MFGIKYRYEVLDDNKIKLAPTKQMLAVTLITTLVTTVLPFVVLSAAAKKIEESERANTDFPTEDPFNLTN